MNLPVEVWGIIFSFLPLNDAIEVSAVCKKFNHETRKNEFWSEVTKLHRNERIIYEKYYDAILFWFAIVY